MGPYTVLLQKCNPALYSGLGLGSWSVVLGVGGPLSGLWSWSVDGRCSMFVAGVVARKFVRCG